MINLINGSLHGSQENICWAENKSSATVVLNTHTWEEGELLVMGYKTKNDGKDIMIGLGIKKGVGTDCYKVLIDKSVVVVTEVLDHIPDVSYYAFDQRYLIRNNEGNLIFTRRYVDKKTGEIKAEEFKAEDKYIVIETSTEDIWICNPPSLISLFELTTRPIIGNVVDLGNGKLKLDLTSEGKTWKDLYFVGSEEKSYLEESVFQKNFEVSVVGKKFDALGKETNSEDPLDVAETVYTLTSKYSGKLVNLDETPDGWKKTDTGVYTKIIEGNKSSSSGSVKCKLTVSGYTGSKTVDNVSTIINGHILIIYNSYEFSTIKGTTKVDKDFVSNTSSLGRIVITPPKDSYVWLAFPVDLQPSYITQIGVRYVHEDTKIISGVIRSGVNLGDNIVYKSLNPGNGENQEIKIE